MGNVVLNDAQPARRKRLRIRVAVVAVALVIVIASGWAARESWDQIAVAWSALTMPGELRDAYFVSNSSGSSVIYTIDGWRFIPEADASFLRAPVVAEPNGFSAITSAGDENPVLEIAGKLSMALPEGATALAVSPDGAKHAFMALSSSTVERTGKVRDIDPNAWSLFLAIAGTVFPGGPGLAPFFIDDTTLGRIIPEGIIALDLPSGTPSLLLKKSFPKTITRVLQSEDRSLLAFADPASGRIYVYRVAGAAPLDEVAALQASDTNLALLTADAVYTLRPSAKGTEIWKHALRDGKAQKIHTLPRSLGITNIAS